MCGQNVGRRGHKAFPILRCSTSVLDHGCSVRNDNGRPMNTSAIVMTAVLKATFKPSARAGPQTPFGEYSVVSVMPATALAAQMEGVNASDDPLA